ncbi:hypothetical protein AMELA_G00261590 [Ameiurus melas]|uniref:Uncharacterized protein n=1 Tax=Ameiurus melas TaxID=219545 RepID=A0A7J5ZP06_AMEME|nr:hypothetical protein AMELA_G00261590 [Ameiurus melas]
MFMVTGNLEPIPGSIRHKAGGGSPSQGTITHPFIHNNQPTMHVFGGNRSTQRNPPHHRENMQTLHTWPQQGSNPQHWRCEANVLTTTPPCARVVTCLRFFCVFFYNFTTFTLIIFSWIISAQLPMSSR